MLPLNKNRLLDKKQQNKTCTNILAKLDTPKRFNRKRQKSNQSLSRSRIQKHETKPNQSGNCFQNSIKQIDQDKKMKEENGKLVDIFKGTGYIKPRNGITKIAETFLCKQHSTKRLIVDKDKRYGKQKNTSFDKVQENRLINQSQNNFELKKISPNKIRKIRSFPISKDLQIKQNTISKQLLNNDCQVDYQLQYQIKCNQISILQQQNKHLKRIINEKISYIDLQDAYTNNILSQKKHIQNNNSIIEQKIDTLINQYSVQFSSQQFHQTTQIIHNIQHKLDKLKITIQHYLDYKSAKYQQIIPILRNQIKHYEIYIRQYEIKAGLVDRFLSQNHILRQSQKKMSMQVNKLQKRNLALSDQINSLRLSNSKVRRTLTDQKKQIISRDIKIKDLQIQLKQAKQDLISTKQQTIKIKKQKLKTQSSVGTIEPAPSVDDIENQNNMSMNISDVSTEELMDLEDLII